MQSDSVSAASESPAAGGRPGCVVIEGVTADGKRFRPSDWNERLHGTLRALDDEDYQAFRGFVHLATLDGGKCVRVDCRLRDENERLYDFFVRFARDNNLRTRELSDDEWRRARAESGG